MTIILDREFFLNQSKVNALCNGIMSGKSIADSMPSDVFYDAEYNGEYIVLEKDTPEAVKKYLNDMFVQECEDDGIEHMEARNSTAIILKVSADKGDIIERTPYSLSYEGYHGDYLEHSTN